jgi:2',3'-cyclic-nucleotide 2'-phosphodiesterase (5'-nucleotidase family)
MPRMRRFPLAVLLFLAGCTCDAPHEGPRAPETPPHEAPATGTVTISIVGTNDLHGHMRALPLLGGYLANLRAAREQGGGAVVLLDGGDVFQGTLESNLAEGAPIVRAYDALGYDAATIGNHEFDYGPVGEHATPVSPDEDPLGALRARIAESHFAWLSANLMARSGGRADLAPPSAVIERAGVRVGVIGVTTEATLGTTLSGNVRELALAPLADSIATEAARLRTDEHVDVVVVTAHAGGACQHFEDAHDLSSCDAHQEIFEVAEALPEHAVDVIVAGHTHQAVAHVVHGIAIIESHSYGRAFGRVDLTIDRGAHAITNVVVHRPHDLCDERPPPGSDPSACPHGDYEGAPVVASAEVAAIVSAATQVAEAQRQRSLGVTLSAVIDHSRGRECALGNMFTDLMRGCMPDADVALYNGGGLRADLPVGPLTYGAFYEALPFDNRFAIVRVTGAELAQLISEDAAHEGSVISISGMRAAVRCEGSTITTTLTRDDGRVVQPDDSLRVVSSDFLATGGDGFFRTAREREGGVTLDEGPPMREGMARVLEAHAGTVGPLTYFDPDQPRIVLPHPRPVHCP